MAFIDATCNLDADFTSKISCHIAMPKLVTSEEALCDLDTICKNSTADLQESCKLLQLEKIHKV